MSELIKSTENSSLNIYSGDTFTTMQRIAKTFASSAIVPQNYQAAKVGIEQATANCFIALQMSSELKINPMTTMQNLYIVNGKPAWSSTFIISCFNTCGRFTPIAYLDNFEAEKDRSKWWCMATAKDKQGNIYKGTKITWTMAETEGWTKKAGSKWLTMPEQMFKYRAATFFIRAIAPEILMGFRPIDEVEDIAANEEYHANTVDATYTVEPAEPQKTEPTQTEKIDFSELIKNGLYEKAEEELNALIVRYPKYDFSEWRKYLSEQKNA